MIVAHEKGLAGGIELEQVVVAAASPNTQVMAHNDLNKLPTLVLADGSSLFDSRVICEYFDTIGSGPALFPAAGEARWITLRRLAQGTGFLDLLVSWLPERRKAAEQRNGELTAALRLKFEAVLDGWENEAADLSGRPFDVGHAALGAALGYADFRYDDLGWRNNRPGLAEFYQTLSERPSFAATAHRDEY